MPGDRLYRVETSGGPVHAVSPRRSRVRVVDGDIFGTTGSGPPCRRLRDPRDCSRPSLPSKIVAVGLNYKDHAAEQGKPLPGRAAHLPQAVHRRDRARRGDRDPAGVGPRRSRGRGGHRDRPPRDARAGAADALDYILGVTCVNDVTARDIQRRENQYTRPKGFDTFAPVGPCIALGLDLGDLAVEGWVNGVAAAGLDHPATHLPGRPSSSRSFPVVMTLLPGDIISTGTPVGHRAARPGDVVTVRVEGVGRPRRIPS